MKDSKTLLLEYLASVRDPERAASLFAEDGAFELPFLRSLGVAPRHTGRGEIAGLIHQLLETLSELRVRAGRYPCPHRDAGKDVRRICGARTCRSDRANAPSTLYWLPRGRGW